MLGTFEYVGLKLSEPQKSFLRAAMRHSREPKPTYASVAEACGANLSTVNSWSRRSLDFRTAFEVIAKGPAVLFNYIPPGENPTEDWLAAHVMWPLPNDHFEPVEVAPDPWQAREDEELFEWMTANAPPDATLAHFIEETDGWELLVRVAERRRRDVEKEHARRIYSARPNSTHY